MTDCPSWCDTNHQPNPWHERWRPAAGARLSVVTLAHGRAEGIAIPELQLALTTREAVQLASALLDSAAELWDART